MDIQSPEALNYFTILRGVIRRHKRLAVVLFFTFALPSIFVVFDSKVPLFEAVATIIIEPSAVEQLPQFRELARRDDVTTSLLILKSRSLGKDVIEALPKDSLDELMAHPQYTDFALLTVNSLRRLIGKPQLIENPQHAALTELRDGRMEFTATANRIIAIRGVATNPQAAMDFVNTHIRALLNRTRTTNQEDNRKMREFLEQQIQQLRTQVSKSEDALTKFQQNKGLMRLPAQSELDLAKLSQTENSLAEMQASRQVLTTRITALRQALAQAAQRDAQPVDSRGVPAVSAGTEAQTQLAALRGAQERLNRLEVKLSGLRERYTEAHPAVQITRDEVASEQARVTRMARDLPPTPKKDVPAVRSTAPSNRAEIQQKLTALEDEDATLQTRAETLRLQAEQLRRNVRNLTQEEVQIGNLRRSVDANRNLLNVFSDKLTSARVREQGESGSIRVLDTASFPQPASNAKTQKLALMFLALAGAISLGVPFTIEFWRQPVETETDVRQATGLPVLGSVALLERAANGKSLREGQNPQVPACLIATPRLPDIPSDLYRAIRANVETEGLREPFRTVLVTSPGPHEGKSTTVLNLGHVLQEFGRRVLIVEADLRRPALHRALGLTNRPGLVDYLAGTAEFKDITRRLPSGVTVIPSQVAHQDPGSLLASPRLRKLLDIAKDQFDVVLFDSAPILAVPDNLLLMTTLDRVILVARASKTRKRDLRKAQQLIERANVKILGVILNQAKPQDIHYYHRQYRKYYRTTNAQGGADGTARPTSVAQIRN